jgi:hypothetical protein
MDDKAILRAFKAWAKREGVKTLTPTYGVQFFVETFRDTPEKLGGLKWPQIQQILRSAKVIDQS